MKGNTWILLPGNMWQFIDWWWKMKRKKITREFREKVVKEYMESGESARSIARKSGNSR